MPATIRNSRLAKQGNAPNSGKFYILLPPAVVAMVVVAAMEQTSSVAIRKLFIVLGFSRLSRTLKLKFDGGYSGKGGVVRIGIWRACGLL